MSASLMASAAASLAAKEQRTTTSTRYEYAKLSYKPDQEVRLCVMLPGERDDPLRREIIHVNLNDHPEYEAVSYTWATEKGDASFCRSIQCASGGYIAMTANCDAVVRQLRSHGPRRRLWIDAICIDQPNIDERSHQVGLRDQIYSQARGVRICLQVKTNPSNLLIIRYSFDGYRTVI
jgi:hypothetical protein